VTSSPLRQAAALLLGVACSDPTQPFPVQSFSVSPALQWSGGLVTLRSAYFIGRSPLPTILAAAETLTAVRVDDSTLTVTMPRRASGTVAVSVAHDGRSDSVAAVQLFGFRSKRTLAPGLAGELLIQDSGGHPVVLGNTDAAVVQYAPIGRIDLVTGLGVTLTTVVGPSTVQYGLAPSTPDGAFAVRDSTDSVRLAMLLTSPPAILGTVPFVGTGFVRQVTQLSPGLWLFTGSHTTSIRAESDPCCSPRFSTPTESPWAVALSPRGDRTTLAVLVVGGRVPVFDNAAGDTAFTLPLGATEGVAFSSDGATLYAVGGSLNQPDTVLAVDATDGHAVAGKVHLPDGFVSFGLAIRREAAVASSSRRLIPPPWHSWSTTPTRWPSRACWKLRTTAAHSRSPGHAPTVRSRSMTPVRKPIS
jgi:dipeptidyl aminopeptidase/acylaminoacyl peptidase